MIPYWVILVFPLEVPEHLHHCDISLKYLRTFSRKDECRGSLPGPSGHLTNAGISCPTVVTEEHHSD